MVTMLGGYDATLLAAQIANMAAGNQSSLYDMAGYYDPYSLGWASAPGGQVPTLARSQLDAQIAQWGVQNSLQQQEQARLQQALDAQIAQWAQQNALDAGTLTGFYNGLPTLDRERLAATIGIANADNFRQWAQMRGSQLLQQQAQDDAMRMAAADSKLQTLGLLASQRGPTNFLAYNSLLNSLSSPDLAATDPFGIAQALMEGVGARTPVDLNSAWNAGVPGGGVPMPNMTAPAGAPSAPSAAPRAGGGGGVPPSPTSTAPRPTTTGSTAPRPTPAPSGTAISGNPGSDQAFFDNTGWANTSPEIQQEFWRISQQMNNDYATQSANAGGYPGYAKGTKKRGASTAKASIVGDVKKTGDPNPELMLNPTGAPFIIVPMDELPRAERINAGMDNMDKPMPHYANGTWGDWWQPQGGASIPSGEQPWQNIDWGSILSGARDQWANMPSSLEQWGQQAQQWRDQLPGWFPAFRGSAQPQNGVENYWNTWGGRPLSFGGNGGQSGGGGGQPGGQTGGGTPGTGTGGTTPPATTGGPTTGQGWAAQGSGRRMGTPFGQVYTNPADSYWSRLPDGYNQERGRLPAFATGTPDTVFGNFGTFTPQQLVDSPLVRKLTGQQGADLWQQYGGNGTMTLPGTSTNLPNTINMATFARMSPSERGMTQGLYETPRAMGGLGLDWADILQASQRAAPLGARFSNAGYGF